MQSEFTLKKVGELEYLESNILKNSEGVKHFFSTRKGGVSTGEFESLNLGIYTNDSKENVRNNFNILCSSLNINENISYLNQEHGNKVFILTKENASEVVGSKGDAIVTQEKNMPIGVFTADCVPILLYDRDKKVAAAIHAGWRGLESKILTNTVNVLKEKFHSKEENIICAIGQCIGECCFEVSNDVAEKFRFVSSRGGSLYVDLLKEAYTEAKECNLLEKNIDTLGRCTVCESDLFHSYRRENGKTGRIGSFIEII